MSFNGSGTYVPPTGQPVAAGTVIQSSTFNTLVTDIGNTFNNVLPRDGQAAMSAPFKLIDGTSSVPGIAFNSEASTGIYRPTTGTLALVASGVENLRINSSGRVMIGTTADDGINRLQVNGPVQVTGTLAATSFSGPLTGNVTGNVSGTAANVTGYVSVANGGTGSATAAGALANLGAAPIASPTFTGTVGGITATMVGLGNVNNTSDTTKPVSTAQQTALDLKVSTSVLASSSGAGIVGWIQAGVGAGAVLRTVQDRMREVVYAEDYTTLALAVAAAAGKTLVLNHTYSIDNSAADGLLVNVDNIRITGTGTINVTSIANSGIKITGKGVTVENITVKGPGTYDTSGTGGAVISGLIYIDGSGLTAPINCAIRNVKALEPGKMGIVAYKAVGFEITGCRVESSLPVATWLNTSNNHLIRAYACARFRITGNRLKGFSEGIVTQAYDSATYNFDDFDGTVGNKSRKFTISNNTVTGTYDHAVYVCNENEHYTCSDNFLWMASDAEGGEGTCSLKLEGGYFEACGNYAREGIQLRNPYFGRVENNVVTIYSGRGTTHNPSKMGILSQDVMYQRGLSGMSVNNNTVTVMGAIDVDAGIWIEGSVWSGYQSQITDLSVCGNTIVGVGQNSAGANGSGILIHQDMPVVGGVVTGLTGQGVTVCGNTVSLSTFTGYIGGTGSYGIELLNIDAATVTGNTVRNFSQRGINLLGVRYSLIGENNLLGNAASASQKFATFEDASNTALHVDSVQNTYGINNAKNVDYKYFLAAETSITRDSQSLVNAGAANYNQTVSAYDECDLFVWAPTGAGLTLEFTTGRPWSIGQKVKVVNRGSQSFNVTNTATTIAPGNAVSFCCTGSNAFITYV